MNSMIYSHRRIGAGLALVIMIGIISLIIMILILTDLYSLWTFIPLLITYAFITEFIRRYWVKKGWF